MGQSFSIQSGIGLPSQRELEQWQAECDRIDEQVAALARRKRGFETLIAAARQLWTDFGVPAPAPEPDPRPAPAPAAPSAPRAGAAPPVSWDKVRAELMDRLPPRPSSDARAAANRPRLVERASILPYKGRLFSPPQPAPAVPEPVPAAPDELAMQEGTAEAIIAFLDRVTVGAPSAVIIAELRKWPHLAGWVDANKAQVLNLISRLVDDGEVLKGGGVYYRNRQRPDRIAAAG